MRVFHITHQGSEVRLKGQTLEVWSEGQRIAAARLPLTETLVLHGAVHVTPAAWARIIDEGIDCVLLSSRGRFRGRIETLGSTAAARRTAQAVAAADPALRLGSARWVVRNKIAAEWRVLRAFRVAPNAGVRALLARLDTASALFELQGMEGWATRLYFTSLRRALPAGFWGWTRQRRPPPDGLNALLSYGYAVLQSRVHSAVGTVGMDPHIGFLHQIGRPRPAFVLDMMEEFRPVVVDYTCWRLAQSWEADGWWERDGEGVRLADEARKALIGAIEQRLGATTRHAATNTRVTVERAIELQVRGFAAGIDGRWDRYRPLRPLVEG